jgi:hypothetical protein
MCLPVRRMCNRTLIFEEDYCNCTPKINLRKLSGNAGGWP